MSSRITRPRRFAGAIAVGAAASLALAACSGTSGDSPDGGDMSIDIAYLATGSALPLFAMAEKYAEEAGIDVNMVEVSSGNESVTGVATAQYDIGFAGIGSAVFNAVDEGLPIRYIAPMHSGYIEDYFILSSTVAGSEEEAATAAEDMSAYAGETFAVNGPGVVTEALLGFALERMDLSYDEVEVEFIPFPDQVPALANGGIVGGILSEPFPTQAEENGSGYRPWPTPAEEPLPFTGIVANTDWMEQNPAAAEGFMEAYAAAAEDLATNGWDTEEMLAINEQYTGADPAVIAASRQHHIAGDLSVDLDAVRALQEFYMEQGSLNYGELIDESEIFDFTLRDAVLGG